MAHIELCIRFLFTQKRVLLWEGGTKNYYFCALYCAVFDSIVF